MSGLRLMLTASILAALAGCDSPPAQPPAAPADSDGTSGSAQAKASNGTTSPPAMPEAPATGAAAPAPEDVLAGADVRKVIPRRTIVTASLDQPMEPDRNVLWCATFQMAWDRLRELAGGDIETHPDSPLVHKLNGANTPADSIPPVGALSLAGLVGDGILEEIRSRLAEVGGAEPKLLPEHGTLPGDAVVAYAWLSRALPFETAFAEMDPMRFGGEEQRVATFGTEGDDSTESGTSRAEQVRVLWHRFVGDSKTDPDQEFVVELLTKTADDRLLLAKIAPAATLAETVEEVLGHAECPNTGTEADLNVPEPTASTEAAIEEWKQEVLARLSNCASLMGDLVVPVIRFDVLHRYDGLAGLTLVAGREQVRGKTIIEARQQVRFVLNRKVASVASEAVGVILGGSERQLRFDDPFLVLLMRRGADVPYFALWIANSELLVAAGADDGEQ